MTGPLVVPAGATGNQVPIASEVVQKAGDTMTGRLTLEGVPYALERFTFNVATTGSKNPAKPYHGDAFDSLSSLEAFLGAPLQNITVHITPGTYNETSSKLTFENCTFTIAPVGDLTLNIAGGTRAVGISFRSCFISGVNTLSVTANNATLSGMLLAGTGTTQCNTALNVTATNATAALHISAGVQIFTGTGTTSVNGKTYGLRLSSSTADFLNGNLICLGSSGGVYAERASQLIAKSLNVTPSPNKSVIATYASVIVAQTLRNATCNPTVNTVGNYGSIVRN
jgi:hypothetical protein